MSYNQISRTVNLLKKAREAIAVTILDPAVYARLIIMIAGVGDILDDVIAILERARSQSAEQEGSNEQNIDLAARLGTAKLTDRERWRRELSSDTPPAVAKDADADLVFSQLLSREAELA